jgi:hypothetical protein
MKGMKWIRIPKWRVTIGAPPKCASTSIMRTLDREKLIYDAVRADKIPATDTVFFIVRQPLDRFKSLWRFRCVPGGDTIHGTGDSLHGMTPEQFWRFIRKAPEDQHWMTQTKLLSELGDRPVTFVRLDDLSRWWQEVTPAKTPLLVLNQTMGRVPSNYKLEQDILNHYEDDVELYNEAYKP